MEPQLLLLDEPLSNLDAKLRERMRFELRRLQRELKVTTVYVTHDQGEALALSHHIAVMNEGRIIQMGSPRDVYERPRSRFVADFVGSTNFLDATVVAAEEGARRYRVKSALAELSVHSECSLRAGEPVVISVRPEDIDLSQQRREGTEGHNICEGIVEARVFLGEHLGFQVKVGEQSLLVRAHPSAGTRVGEKVFLAVHPEKCVAIPN